MVADGNNGGLAQTDRDGFMNKTLYGALDHAFSDQWSGFVRGFGYSNRTAYDGYYSSFTPDVLVDTRQLYSQTGTQDYALTRIYSIHSCSPAIATAKTITTTLIWAVTIRRPRWMKSNSTTFSGSTPLMGHGNIGAGVDWQKQSTEPGTNYVTNGYNLRNTGVYLTGLQQLGDFTLEGAVRSDDNSQFGRHGTAKQCSVGVRGRLPLHCFLWYGL